MKNISLAFMLIAASVLTACTSALVGGGNAQSDYGPRDTRSSEQITEDAVITSKVNARLVNDSSINARNINIETISNTVYLRGVVDSAAMASRAVSLAQGVNGVRGVVNKLKVIR